MATRSRVIIDIQLPTQPDIVKHVMSQYWCGKCGRMIEKIVTDALPGFTTGLKTTLYSAYLHYHLGMSISNVINTLNVQGMIITSGALVGSWHALAGLFKPFYRTIQTAIKNCTDAVYADETSVREKGKKSWLWMFATKNAVFFVIRKSRGGKVVREILGKVFHGILVTDFWKPYHAVKALLRQWCVAHLLREFKKIEYARSDLPDEYWAFKKKVKRLFKDAMRIKAKNSIAPSVREAAFMRFLKRLDAIVACSYDDADVKRLIKRLKKYRDGFFTFVVHDVDATNNYSERMIRYAVIMRKVSLHTMSGKGSDTMSILMSVFKTLDLQGYDVFQESLNMAKNAIEDRKYRKNHLAA
jgi:transposase